MRLPSPGADADVRHRLGAVPNPFRDGDLGEVDDYGVQRAGLGARGHGARPGAPRARTVLKLATISRLVAVAWAALSFVAVGEYDKSAGLSLGPLSPDGDAGRLPPYDFWAAAQANSAPPRTPWDCLLTGRECSVSTVVGAVRRLIRPLVRWDALHFRHIAEEGYIWEHEFAFFPLLPAVMRLGAETVLAPLSPILPLRDRVELAGILFTNACAVFAALALYRLTLQAFVDERIAFLSAVCFCINPSGIFMSSIYSESPFALLTFVGHSFMLSGRYTGAAALWCLASMTRANGIMYCGFFVWEFAFQRLSARFGLMQQVTAAMDAVPYILVVLAGFLGFQYFAWTKHCATWLRPPDRRPWCDRRLPLVYSFVQREYWNNGFLNYWTTKQAPNFLLASCILAFSAWGIWTYAAADWRRFLSAGIYDPRLPDGGIGGWFTTLADMMTARFPPPLLVPPIPSADAAGFPSQAFGASRDMLPHVYLWAFLLGLNTLFTHVQIAARFLSGLPVLYWFAATVLLRDGGRASSRIVVTVAVVYAAVGLPLFAGFFPPA